MTKKYCPKKNLKVSISESKTQPKNRELQVSNEKTHNLEIESYIFFNNHSKDFKPRI